MLQYFIIIALSVLIYTSLWYFYGQKLSRLDVADEAWGLAQPYIVIVAMLLTKSFTVSSIILLLLMSVWGYRLFSHLRKRHASSSREDKRYTDMKAGWKKYPRLKAYLFVFLLQGALMYLLGIGSMLLVYSNPSWNVVSVIGVAIWLLGFVFEKTADNQLKNYIAKPENKGKIMDQGLWKYSRHPNYFGEVTMWWGIFAYVLINTGFLWAIITPLTITYLIIFVSGIPLTEKSFASNPLWLQYKNKTSALIPWFNRK